MITATLRNRFIFGPPLWTSIIALFDGLEHRMKLIQLTEEYLPDWRYKIGELPPTAAAEKFRELFGKTYFPLETFYYYDDKVRQITAHIPVQLHGLQENRYEPSYNRFTDGQLLAEVLCQCPFENQSRLTVLDRFHQQHPKKAGEMLKIVPEGGYRLEEIERALIPDDGSETYPGLLIYCRWLFARTGCFWLDNAQQNLEWSRPNVNALKDSWHIYQDLDKQMKRFDAWLGHHTIERIAEIIKYIRGRVPKTLMEVFRDDKNKADHTAV